MCGWLRAAQPESVYLINCVYKHWTPFVCVCVCVCGWVGVFAKKIKGTLRTSSNVICIAETHKEWCYIATVILCV